MRAFWVWLAFGSLALPAQALEMAVNGDFEQPLTTGWRQETFGSTWSIGRATNFDPDPDYEVFLSQDTGFGSVRLCQEIVLPSLEVEFSAHARIHAFSEPTSWAGAAVKLSYMDQHGIALGETYICVISMFCPWWNTPTTHLIMAPDGTWHDFAFNLADELVNLPGVDPAAIHQVQVSLLAQTTGC